MSLPIPAPVTPLLGGLQFKDVAPMICTVVDNGVCPDDPRVMVRLNEATKTILDYMIPVGGMAIANVAAVNKILYLPPQMENVIFTGILGTGQAYNQDDITLGWYEIVNNSTYVDPEQSHDNPLVDLGLVADPTDRSILRRSYIYPGLSPSDAMVQVIGAKRYLPITNDEDYLIVQNIEALKCIILSIERYENNAVDDAQKYRQAGLEILQAEVKKHMLDPRYYSARKAFYRTDLTTFAPNTLGWIRAQIALDVPAALRAGKFDLTWTLNQVERRLMERGTWKDCIIPIQADVVGGLVYFPLHVESVLAVDLNGLPIPIRSQFFQHLENGPGMFPAYSMLVDQGDEYFPGTKTTRRKYKLVADCHNGQCINAVCKLRWLEKKPGDRMVIKNYEALRLMMTAKFLEEQEKWKEAQANEAAAFQKLEAELRGYLAGILHTVHVQTIGFGLNDVGNYWTQ
jgi:hypothetical protein